MKKLLCKDLGGPCEAELVGDTFEEIGKASQVHVMEQIQKGDKEHQEAVNAWMSQSEDERQKKMQAFEDKFNNVSVV